MAVEIRIADRAKELSERLSTLEVEPVSEVRAQRGKRKQVRDAVAQSAVRTTVHCGTHLLPASLEGDGFTVPGEMAAFFFKNVCEGCYRPSTGKE